MSRAGFTIIYPFIIVFLTLIFLIRYLVSIITDNLSFVKRLLGLRGRIGLDWIGLDWIGWCMDVALYSGGLLYLFEF